MNVSPTRFRISSVGESGSLGILGSWFSATLVLENDRMFAEFGIARTARRAGARSDHAFGALASAEQHAPRRDGGRVRPLREAQELGSIGLLRGGDSESPRAGWAASPKGHAPEDAHGHMLGDPIADSYGSGGLGLSGVG